MPRIAWIEDADAQGELPEIYAGFWAVSGRPIPDIYRTISLRPDFLAPIL
jgi:hypothetical protein